MSVGVLSHEQIEQDETHLGTENGMPNTHRKPTDVCFLTVFATFLTILSCFIGYCVYHGDIGRVIYGYDNCGTTCGDMRRNKDLEDCYEQMMGEIHFGSYHLVRYREGQSVLFDRICTNNCSNFRGYKEFFNRCLPSNKKTAIDKFFTKTGLKDFFVEVCEDFGQYWKVFVHMCLLSFVTSVSVFLLFRFLSRLMVWTILIGVVLVCLAATVYSWISWKELRWFQSLDSEIENREVNSYLALAIICTVATAIVVLIISVMIKRVKLVLQIFEEAGEAISDMPYLLLEPLLTFFAIIIIVSLWIYFSLWISSAGYLTKKRAHVYYYRKDGVMEAAKWLSCFGMLWMVQFVVGCQHMVIAGAVSKWYFVREKSQLSTPLIESFYNLTRYHLGTVAIGSFLIAIVQILRAIVHAWQKMLKKWENPFLAFILNACWCCLWILEQVLDILNRNCYIVTAMFGYSFYKAGKQAFAHISSNVMSVAAINSVGDLVLFLSKLLVVACTVGIASYFLKNKEGVQHAWVPLVLIALFSYFISHCFMTVYEMTIDTIFICFCEDCAQNNGGSRPYYMSRGLMEFVENSKRAVKKKSTPELLSTVCEGGEKISGAEAK